MKQRAVGQIECPSCHQSVFVVKDSSDPNSVPYISNHGKNCAGGFVELDPAVVQPINPEILQLTNNVAYVL